MTDHVQVPFAGPGAGVEELSWGQREIWHAMVSQGSWFPIGGVKRLPAGTSVDDVAGRLRYIMERYQSARTRLRLTTVGGDGGPWQVVSSRGEITLDIVDTDGADPAETAERVRQRFCDTAFDFENDWPVRMAAVRHDGTLTHLVTIFCHLFTDAFGWLTLRRDIRAYEADPTTVQDQVTAMQPLDQARWQRSPDGRRHNQAALRHWERLLDSVPAPRSPADENRFTPRHWHGRLDSTAAHLAIRALAARHDGLDSSAVLLGLIAIALARLTGTSPVAIRPVVSNRFRPRLATSVSPINQAGLCVLDVAGQTVTQAIQRASVASLAAYRWAYVDPVERDRLIDAVGARRGTPLDLSCYLNDRRTRARERPGGVAPSLSQVVAAKSRSAFRWLNDVPTRERFFIHVENEPDTLAIVLSADTRLVGPADIEAYLWSIEHLAIATLADPSIPTGLFRPVRA